MSDPLVSLIEKVIETHQATGVIDHCACGWEWTPGGDATCVDQHIAVEVIRELGLTVEWLERRHSEARDYRYVTDWKADDE
jgi:hypothetical protein